MKKITSLLLTLAMLASLFTAVPAYATSDVWGDAAVADALSGAGTTDDPFLISNAAELRYMNELVNTGASYTDAESATQHYYAASYKLTADIDLENTEWRPIGWALPLSYDTSTSTVVRDPDFRGNFDGANHVIKNVKITNSSTASTTPTSKYMGFFGYTYGATITNLGLDNIDIQWANHDYLYDTTNNKTERNDYYGTFIGGAAYTNISNCYVVNSTVKNTNTSTNDYGVGGFIGAMNFNNSISNCYVYNVTLQAAKTKTMSGFAGNCLSGTNAISNSYAAKINIDRESTFATTYGFMWDERGLATNTATNCYSTLADAQGTFYASYSYSKKYDSAKSKGETGVTSEALIDAMLETGAYAQDATINDGYPYLKTGFDGTPAESFTYGSGTEDDPWLISTPGELLLASRQVNAGNAKDSYFKLLNDIDYGYQPWEPIGYSNDTGVGGDFCGGFDGDGHVVKNLTLGTGNYYYCGFFGLLTGATIKDLGIENFQLIRGNAANFWIRVVGGFAGAARANSTTEKGTTITNCYVKKSSVHQTRNYSQQSAGLYTDSNLGGFIGHVDIRNYQTEIKNCYVDTVSLYSCYQGEPSGFIGGLTEYNKTNSVSVKLTNCYASNITDGRGDGSTTRYAFGYVGNNGGDPYIFDEEKIVLSNCYSTFKTEVGSNTDATKLVDDNYFGTEVTDPATIANAFSSLEGWQNGALINAGLPALSWEIAPSTPDYAIKAVNKEIVTMNVSGSSGSYDCNLTSGYKVTVDIARKAGVTDVANVYVAGYDIDDRLTGAQMATVNADDFSFTADINGKNAVTVKVFLWDEENAPILNPYIATTSINAPLDEVWYFSGTTGGDGEGGGSTVIPQKKTRLVMMGDSIMDSVHNEASYEWDKRGWEGYIGNYLNNDMTIIKHGHNGQTIKMFMEGRSYNHVCDWASIKTQFGKGDYVILSLGRNDNGCITRYVNGNYTDECGMVTVDGEDRAYYSADWFKTQYRTIIDDIKAKGATVILLTPIPGNGDYSSTTGKFSEELVCKYSRQAIIEVAQEKGVAYIDMAKVYSDALNAMIDSGEKTLDEIKLQYTNGTPSAPGYIFVDSVHLTEEGADLLARLVAEELEKMTTGMENFIEISAE